MTTAQADWVLAGLFWGSAALIVYAYVVFPALVALHSLASRPYVVDTETTPKVSVLIAAHNEAEHIGAKLDNLFALDYPCAQLEVIIASDGSTDGTNELVSRRGVPGLRLLPLARCGKAAALNAAAAEATGEILVFSDANSLYATQALRALVAPFADPRVGGVAGNQVYGAGEARSAAAAGEQLYWRFDRWLKWRQSHGGNTISATGAIYAIRRALFQPVPEGVTDDFVTSTRVIAAGWRLVFAPAAVACEPVAKSSGVEFGRKVRVITRGLRGVWHMRALLNPFRHGWYACQLLSHKVVRRLVAVPLLVCLATSPLLWHRGWIYQAATCVQWAVYAPALLGLLLRHTRVGRWKVLALPFYFVLVNAAALVALLNTVRGHRIVVWEPQRSGVSGQPALASSASLSDARST